MCDAARLAALDRSMIARAATRTYKPFAVAAKVKRMALGADTKSMESLFAREGISPGGSADMLALTLLADSLLQP